MHIDLRTVEGLAEPPGYAHVAVATGARLVFTAGAVPLDATGELVGPGDAAAQTEQVIANLLRQLEDGGAAPGDVVKTTVYVAGASHETQGAVWKVVQAFAARPGALDAGRRRPARLPRATRGDRSDRRHRRLSCGIVG